jgi:7,8-dihydropterin-6-yl-methyl-4-(beta-D-ribofuranosyl)aminobenzene 5'-phosphate synthase
VSALLTADSVEIQILVDNATDGLSSVPSFVETEIAYHWRRGMRELAGACLCCAAHGLSCLVTAVQGSTRKTLLFDTGPDSDVFRRNVTLLKLDLAAIDGIMLSHGHWDHGGALLTALDMIRAASAGRRTPLYMHPGMFQSRAMRTPDGTIRPMADIASVAELTAHGADVVLSSKPEAILGQLFHVSGEIPRVTPFERGLPGQVRRASPAATWEPDELLMDERSVAINVAGKGLVVLSACSHAGIVNVLSHARAQFPRTSIHCVMGGLHLSGTNEEIIPETVGALASFAPAVIAAGHCTGWRATVALANAFGQGVLAPLAVGKRFTF